MRTLLVVFITLFSASWAWAAALVQSASGDTRIEMAGVTSQLRANQKIDSGATIHTGTDGKVVLRFDDGQMAAINSETSFKVEDYRFEAAKPEQGNIAFSLLKGALRLVTGLIGERNQKAFALKTPNATIGIRGTDFMVATVNPTYLSVIQGSVATTNAAGTAVFGAGTTATITSTAALGAAIPASALPSSVAASFSSLSSAAVSAGVGAGTGGGAGGAAGGGAGGAAGAGAQAAAAAAAGGGISVGVVAAGAAVVGVAAAVAGSSEAASGTTTSTGTTGTQ